MAPRHHTVGRRTWKYRALFALGWALRIVSFFHPLSLCLLLGAYRLYTAAWDDSLDSMGWWPPQVFIMHVCVLVYDLVCGLLGALFSVFLFNRGNELILHAKWRLARPAREVMLRDPRRLVLYLRSFKDDHLACSAPIGNIPQSHDFFPRTEEEYLTKAVSKMGPLVALGDPERYPQVGASRLSTADNQWREEVVDLMMRARLVILRLNCASESLMWEFHQAVIRLAPQQVLLLVPCNSEKYECFRRQIEKRGWLVNPLPPWPKLRCVKQETITGAVYFKPGWTPEVIEFSGPPGPSGLNYLFRRHGYKDFGYTDITEDLEPVFTQLDLMDRLHTKRPPDAQT